MTLSTFHLTLTTLQLDSIVCRRLLIEKSQYYSSPDYLVLTYSFGGFVWIMSDNFLWFMSTIYRSHRGVFRITEQIEIEVSDDRDSSEGIYIQ